MRQRSTSRPAFVPTTTGRAALQGQPLSDGEFAFLQSAVVLLGSYLPDTAA